MSQSVHTRHSPVESSVSILTLFFLGFNDLVYVGTWNGSDSPKGPGGAGYPDCVSMSYDLVGAYSTVFALFVHGQCRLQVYVITFTHNDDEWLLDSAVNT